jgi:hypothetical protein
VSIRANRIHVPPEVEGHLKYFEDRMVGMATVQYQREQWVINIYKLVWRRLLFKLDPDATHEISLRLVMLPLWLICLVCPTIKIPKPRSKAKEKEKREILIRHAFQEHFIPFEAVELPPMQQQQSVGTRRTEHHP